ncbi:MAG: hypothetical protein LBP37_04010 [Spirochaetaceae bacterium]|jgi:hypothetical protein|nr:hypothetical protein [Spirochaetaceae bacterium]
MTIKETAGLCGVDETTVLRWIGKMVDGSVLNCEMQLRNSPRESLTLIF